MSHHPLPLALLVLTLFLTACSTAPEPRSERIDLSPTMTPLQALEAAGPYLPADSIGVMIASGPDGWDGLESYVFPLADGLLTPGSPGTARGLRDDLNDLFKARLGFSLMDLHTVVVGGNVVGIQVLAFGDIEFNSDLPTVDSPAGAVYELPLRHLTSGVDAEPNPFFDPSVYILPLESPHRGVAFSLSPAAFGETSGLSESAHERLRGLIAEVEDRSPSALFAIFGEDLPPVPTGDLPLPDGLLLSVGPFLTTTFSGEPEVLDAIEEALADFFANARGELQPTLDALPSAGLPEALVALYGHHLLEGFSAQLAPRRAEALLTYEVELSDRGWLSLLAIAQLGNTIWQEMRSPGSISYDNEVALIAVTNQRIPAGSTVDPSMVEAAEFHIMDLPYDAIFWFDLEFFMDLPLENDVEAGELLRESHFTIPTYQEDLSELDLAAPADVAAPPADAEVTNSGLASKVLQAGHGQEHPTATSVVTVHYTGWTTDGERFDSSVARGQPTTFGLDYLIAGWTEGLQLMVVGEKRRLWIPEDLAYGGMSGRPAGMLVYDVELISIDAPQ